MSLQQRKLRIIISGGGTGGHIFPAIAIANELKKINSENEILFVGALGRMEMEKIPAAGYKITGLNISGIQRKLSLKNLLIPFKVIQSVLKAKSIIKEFSPDVVVGVGGYASGPLLYAATAMKIPSLIQEQNSFAGLTNKILSKRVDRICVAYEGMEKFFPADKIIMTGNPVRKEMVKTEGKRDEALKFFGLEHGKKTILVIGGSLGAGTINRSIEKSLNDIKEKGFQLIWQTGKNFGNRAAEAVKSVSSKNIFTTQFIQRMDFAYAAADIIISRAGASSVSEIALTGIPSILIPSPNVAEDHQTKNAMALVKNKAAILLSDERAESDLMNEILKLINNESLQNEMRNNVRKLSIDNSAERIVKEIYSITK
jgi:UDP-N-acetylglucosamine--N-acetylmuramyl-(pentapeptide) pyrophosphoryl-undecaprenol N-acetylglucosamine transferase